MTRVSPSMPSSSLGQANFIWGRKTSVDCEISIIDFLGMECRKYRERESKKKPISWVHKDCLDDYASLRHQWIQFYSYSIPNPIVKSIFKGNASANS